MKKIVIDIETTGINPKNDRILEIGIIEVENWKIINEFSTLLNPKVKISENAYKVHKISEKMLIDAPTFEEISSFIREKLNGSLVFGYKCLKFDLTFINYELFRVNKIPIFPIVVDLSYLNDFFNVRSLYQMGKRIGIKISKKHRALSDAKITFKIIRWIVEHFSEQFFENFIFKYESKLEKLVKITNENSYSKIIYRNRYKISEYIGFPVEINKNFLIFYNSLNNKFYKLYKQRIIDVDYD